MASFEGNRVVRDTGARFPVLLAPIGIVARSQLGGAVSAAGGFGLLSISALSMNGLEREYEAIRAKTDAPFGVSIVLPFLKTRPPDEVEAVLEWALDGKFGFVHTAGGSPRHHIARFRDAGIVNYHAVESAEEAMKAEDAGVHGLIVESAESGGVRRDNAQHMFTLLQSVRERVDLPIVAAGGVVDGRGMAAAFALGAEGVVMGTRFMCSTESPLHDNYKAAIATVPETMAVHTGIKDRTMRVLRNEFSERVVRGEIDPKGNPYAGPALELFMNGRLDLAMAGVGQSAQVITAVKSVAEIIDDTVEGFWAQIERLSALLPASA